MTKTEGQSNSEQEELRDICADIQLLTGLDDYEWRLRFKNDAGLYGFITDHTERVRREYENNWWVTSHDTPGEPIRIAGPFSTIGDASRARQILERAEDHHNYWLEKLHQNTNKPKEGK